VPADDRAPSFQFYPKDYLSDSIVSAMTPEQRGGYVHLLCHAWSAEECGVLPDDDELLARLSDLRDRWQHCRLAIRSAFRSAMRSATPVLVQRRMVLERAKQERRRASASEGARITNAKRWGSVAQRPDSESLRVSLAFASSSSVEEESKTGSLPSKAAVHANGGVTAACLHRMKVRFPKLDLSVIEAKLISYHEQHPFKSLDRAFVNWCKSAESRGIDGLASEEAWVP